MYVEPPQIWNDILNSVVYNTGTIRTSSLYMSYIYVCKMFYEREREREREFVRLFINSTPKYYLDTQSQKQLQNEILLINTVIKMFNCL